MLIDARWLKPKTIKTDICIVGAGPAGISLAREFINHQMEVTLIESGGLDFDPKIQSLAGGFTHGDIKPSIDVNHRQFGGNANVWNIGFRPGEIGVRHAIFDEIDFIKRDWVPNSGWPFGRKHLIPYYKRAQVVCHAGPFLYSPEYWEDKQVRRLPLDKTDLETGIFQFGSSQIFYKHYRDELIATKNISIYTYASAVELMTNESGKTITQIRVARPGGHNFWISARIFILATGGFENARLLLMSNQQQKAGLGNQHDVVGRYYHDHLQGRSGYFTPADSRLFNQMALYDLRQVNETSGMGYLKLSKAIMEKEKLLNINCFLYPKPDQRRNLAIESFNFLRREGGFLKPPCSVASVFPKQSRTRHVLNTLKGSEYVFKMACLAQAKMQSTSYGLGNGGWSKLRNISKKFKQFEVWHSIEQSPHPNNRITLSPERDMFGCQKLQVHWHWPQGDINQTLRAQNLIARELERAGLGKLKLEHDPQGLPNIVRPVGSHHLMGTTRMHADPKKGVVDADCRVHGINNLYVAGSSTFPAGGYANPTLTIVAMALRLGDLLKQQLAAQASSNMPMYPTVQTQPGNCNPSLLSTDFGINAEHEHPADGLKVSMTNCPAAGAGENSIRQHGAD
jgi:choline dehydrogenase-like flavoprotein